MDQMVLNVQRWLNATYIGKGGYTYVTEDGLTGWSTIRALITALQIEEGIASPNGTFGPATEAACPTLSIDTESSSLTTNHEIFILQGALYCKGYNPNSFDGKFESGTQSAIIKLQKDAGLSNQDGIATPMIFKALLNMDAFILVKDGDEKIRQIQQYLNRDYNNIIGLMPCNGIYSKQTNRSLIKALQFEEGLTPDGIWGPSTASQCPVLNVGSTKNKFILLLQYALYCNGFDPNGFDGYFGNGAKTAVTNFQSFSALTADGIAGMQTWASLLVSYGDKNRKGRACDCATTITAERAQTLKNNGYKSIGRYLTGTYELTPYEIQTILNAGLNVFPIFERGGYKLSYFSKNQGTNDAHTATTAARNLGFPAGTIIYFAVDFDALDTDVTNAIIPYFEGINEWFKNNSIYKIGIYGARNVCSRVADRGYSCSSFVCDMSSGFSGNLGYPLPKDWAIDQISTITIGSYSGEIEIDNDISKYENIGVSEIDTTEEEALSLIKTIDTITQEYSIAHDESPSISVINTHILNTLRYYKYGGFQWLATINIQDYNYVSYLNEFEPEVFSKLLPYIQDTNTITTYIHGKGTDLPHLAATTLGYYSSPFVPNFWIGWGGDIATAMADVTRIKDLPENKGKTIDVLSMEVIGSNKYSCSRIDIENDIDSIYLASKLEDNTFGSLLDEYFSTVTGSTRKNILLNDLGFTNTPTEEALNSKINTLMTGNLGFELLGIGGQLKGKATYNSIEPTNEIINGVTLAFSKYILNTL